MTERNKAIKIIRESGGIIRTSSALRDGISPRMLYMLRDDGILEEVSRGVYRLAELSAITNPDLLVIGTRIPRAVICLTSALSFHEMTTQIPHKINIALERGAEAPRLEYPPLSIHRFCDAALNAGIETHSIDGVAIRVYNPEKTIADCFKFRNKLGNEVVVEALRLYRERKVFNVDNLLKYGRICRVEKIMKPYLEAII